MKTAILAGCLATAALALTACGNSEEEKSEMFAQCNMVLGDRTLSPNLREAGTSPDAACTCLAATLEDGDDDNQEKIQTFFAEVSTRMSATDENAKQAVDKLVSGALLPEDSEAQDGESFADILAAFNRTVNGMLTEMGENDGVCPAI